MINVKFEENDIVSHDELCKSIGVGCMGGMRFSKKNNVLVLFMKDGSKYENAWDGNILRYMGCGKGNQSIDKMGNKRLAESTNNDTTVLLFEWVDNSSCRFVGTMVLAGAPYYETKYNNLGEEERKIIFPLKRFYR